MSEFTEVVATLGQHCVLVVGDVMLDEYICGQVRRISPEAPIPVVEVERKNYTPGGAANVAVNISRLGGRAMLGGVVGQDHSAAQLRGLLRENGVEATGLMIDEKRPTSKKTRIVASSQHLVRVDSELRTTLVPEVEYSLLNWIQEVSKRADAFVISDYAKGVVSPQLAEKIIHLAKNLGKPVVVDPKGTNYSKYRGATVITPNVHEAERALNCEINGHTELLEVGKRLLRFFEGSALLITQGRQGMSLFMNGADIDHIPAVARNIFDVTGAGDTVIGTLALGLAAGASLNQAAKLANCAAGIVVGKVGTATITIEELMSMVCLEKREKTTEWPSV